MTCGFFQPILKHQSSEHHDIQRGRGFFDTQQLAIAKRGERLYTLDNPPAHATVTTTHIPLSCELDAIQP